MLRQRETSEQERLSNSFWLLRNLSHKGLTLIELMVGMTLSLIVGLGLLSIILSSSEFAINMQSLDSALDLVTEIKKSLSSEEECKKTVGKNLGENPINLSVDPTITDLSLIDAGLNMRAEMDLDVRGMHIKQGEKFKFGTGKSHEEIEVESLFLRNIKRIDAGYGDSYLSGNLEIGLRRVMSPGKGHSSEPLVSNKIYSILGLMIKVDKDSKFQSCSVEKVSELEDVCVNIGGVWENSSMMCKLKFPNCNEGDMLVKSGDGEPQCLSFRRYLARLCGPGRSLRVHQNGGAIRCR